MKKKLKIITIDLTQEQLKKLLPMTLKADSAAKKGKLGVILAQVWPCHSCMRVQFFDNKIGSKMIEIVHGEKQ